MGACGHILFPSPLNGRAEKLLLIRLLRGQSCEMDQPVKFVTKPRPAPRAHSRLAPRPSWTCSSFPPSCSLGSPFLTEKWPVSLPESCSASQGNPDSVAFPEFPFCSAWCARSTGGTSLPPLRWPHDSVPHLLGRRNWLRNGRVTHLRFSLETDIGTLGASHTSKDTASSFSASDEFLLTPWRCSWTPAPGKPCFAHYPCPSGIISAASLCGIQNCHRTCHPSPPCCRRALPCSCIRHLDLSLLRSCYVCAHFCWASVLPGNPW